MIWFVNRKPGFEQVARRMSGRSPGQLRLSAITLAELRFGIENAEFRAANRQALVEVLQLFQADDLPGAAAQDFGEINKALVRKGELIGPYDMLIAAHARHMGAAVVTDNEAHWERSYKMLWAVCAVSP